MKTKVKAHKRTVAKKNLYITIDKSPFGNNTYDINLQVEGYPKTSGYVEGGDTVGLSLQSAKELVKEVAKDARRENPDLKVIVKK